MKSFTLAVALIASLARPTAATAQQPPPPPTPPAASRPAVPLIPLRVDVVIAKFQADKKISSAPYTLAVNANERNTFNQQLKIAELTSAIDVLIPMVTVNEKTTGPVYKDVGTNIKCGAETIEGGRFKLELNVEDQSVYPDAKVPADGNRGPWLQVFRSNQTLILKDGQTTEYTVATDQVSGQVTKVSVTLTVVK